MARYDRVLIDPDTDEVYAALREAIEAANEKRRLRLVSWPLPRLAEVMAQMSEPHGHHQWNGGDGNRGHFFGRMRPAGDFERQWSGADRRDYLQHQHKPYDGDRIRAIRERVALYLGIPHCEQR